MWVKKILIQKQFGPKKFVSKKQGPTKLWVKNKIKLTRTNVTRAKAWTFYAIFLEHLTLVNKLQDEFPFPR